VVAEDKALMIFTSSQSFISTPEWLNIIKTHKETNKQTDKNTRGRERKREQLIFNYFYSFCPDTGRFLTSRQKTVFFDYSALL